MRRGEGAGMLFLFDAVPYREWQVNRFTTPLRARLEELRTITDGISSPFVDYLHHAPVTAEEVPHVARIAYANRSEAHTSELQSLMRISYAVFRLKKKKQTTNNIS